MKTLLRISLFCALLASVVSWVGGGSPAAAQHAHYTDLMTSEADGLLNTASPDPARIILAYQDGTYVMQALDQAFEGEILTSIETPPLEGTAVLVDIEVSGDVTGKYAIVGCRAGAGNDGYQLEVNLDTGKATLRRMHREFPQVLSSTEEPVGLNPDSARNLVGIECRDNKISALVNGRIVLTQFDAHYTSGHSYIGVGSWGASSDGLTAVFDNLTVADLGSSGFAHPDGNNHGSDTLGKPQVVDGLFTYAGEVLLQTEIMTTLVPSSAGPLAGEFDLRAGEGASLPLGVQLEDFYAQLGFVTPQVPGGLWLYGFCFWADSAGNCTRLFIQSDGLTAKWGFGSVPATGESTLVDSGSVADGSLDLAPGAENWLEVLVDDGLATLAVNGQVVTTFALDVQPLAGDVVGQVEFSSNDPTSTAPLTMSAQNIAVWDLSNSGAMVAFEETSA